VVASARGHELALFGFALPQLIGRDRALARAAFNVHSVLAWTLLGLVALHAAAAIWHHVVARDPTLRRMLPRRSGIELGFRR
jgi:cytochrome b561